ncbi:pseudouridylate synthase 7 homolog isoform X1 [Frieseomelitta varia]|uniref:pseudouridylate synthase 7 homolog isoform X1 n=1 Tax=Frieseomelitta varia TaxID=561572 RepID=UPI001CB6B043|nr:pseudouridylate synthase 7 homolog isoform X1 [Frieseomelitta varia]
MSKASKNIESEKHRKDSRKNNRWGKKKNNGSRNDNFKKSSFKRNLPNFHSDEKRKKLQVGNRLKECDVGITEFIGSEGFFGVIKERYSDFQVNEIAADGQIAKLTNQDVPSDGEDESTEDPQKMIPSAIWSQLQEFKKLKNASLEIDVTNLSKDQRKAIHSIAKSMKEVLSQTVDRENKKILMILPNKYGNNKNFRKDTRINWKNQGKYCYFLLHKVNMDTMAALNRLAMNLRLNPNSFSYAGTKDRRAWTTQWVSVKKIRPTNILRAAKNIRGAYIGNFKFEMECLKLGMLNGNCFRIALRNVSGTDEQIEKSMISLREHGFINYYGMQRFGTVATIPTYEIGKALLQGKWNEAIDLILKPREGENDEDVVEARKIYAETKDASAAYKRIKNCNKVEAILLKGLSTCNSNNPQGALDLIPRNVRLIYIHAYQSFVWNHIVSKRIREFGKNPVVGDLVYEKDVKSDNEEELVTEDEEANEKVSELGNEEDVDEEMEKPPETFEESPNTLIKEMTDTTECCLKVDEKYRKNTEKSRITNEKNENNDSYNLPAVKILEEKDLPNYTLADVLMPQVGWKVTYPPYAKPWFDEFLAKDGLTTDLRQKNKKYTLGGAYRKILQIPSNLSWNVMHYSKKHADLIMCDINEMRKCSAPKDDPEGKYKALIIQMSLKSSTYATMALREILKSDTSPQVQAAQSAACEAEFEKSNISEKTKNTIKDDNKSSDMKKHFDIEDDKMEISN